VRNQESGINQSQLNRDFFTQPADSDFMHVYCSKHKVSLQIWRQVRHWLNNLN